MHCDTHYHRRRVCVMMTAGPRGATTGSPPAPHCCCSRHTDRVQPCFGQRASRSISIPNRPGTVLLQAVQALSADRTAGSCLTAGAPCGGCSNPASVLEWSGDGRLFGEVSSTCWTFHMLAFFQRLLLVPSLTHWHQHRQLSRWIQASTQPWHETTTAGLRELHAAGTRQDRKTQQQVTLQQPA